LPCRDRSLSSIVTQGGLFLVWAGHDFNFATRGCRSFPTPFASPIFCNGFGVTWVSPSISFRSDTGIDENGHRVLLGLSIEETFEFETLDIKPRWTKPALVIAWRDGVPIANREKRGSNSTKNTMKHGEKCS